MEEKNYDIFGTICFFIIICIPFLSTLFPLITYNSKNKQEFINYCKLYKNIKIVDKSFIKKNYVVKRNFIYLINKYRIEEEDEKVKDIKLYFDNTLIYNLREIPINYISNNKVTDCDKFYDNYVEDREN